MLTLEIEKKKSQEMGIAHSLHSAFPPHTFFFFPFWCRTCKRILDKRFPPRTAYDLACLFSWILCSWKVNVQHPNLFSLLLGTSLNILYCPAWSSHFGLGWNAVCRGVESLALHITTNGTTTCHCSSNVCMELLRSFSLSSLNGAWCKLSYSLPCILHPCCGGKGKWRRINASVM